MTSGVEHMPGDREFLNQTKPLISFLCLKYSQHPKSCKLLPCSSRGGLPTWMDGWTMRADQGRAVRELGHTSLQVCPSPASQPAWTQSSCLAGREAEGAASRSFPVRPCPVSMGDWGHQLSVSPQEGRFPHTPTNFPVDQRTRQDRTPQRQEDGHTQHGPHPWS